MNFSVTKNGLHLSPDLYTWDEKTKTFSTNESHLVLDFNNMKDITFKTGSYCVFATNSDCVFETGSDCVFETSSDCVFETGSYCILDTGSWCTFDTSSDCVFKTGSDCTFKTGPDCVIIRRDVFEIIQLEPNVEIKLNKLGIQGFEVINHTYDIDGKTITLSEESF